MAYIATQQTMKFFITITLKPLAWRNNPLSEVDNHLAEIQKHLIDVCKFQGDLYMEITSKAHIHFHGLGSFKVPSSLTGEYVIKYVRKIIKLCKPIGHIRVVTPKNENRIEKYIKKDHAVSMNIFHCHQVIEDGLMYNGLGCCPDAENDVYEDVL